MKGESSQNKNEEIWNLSVSGAVKKFVWKAVYDLLPTKKNLFQKKITENSLCPIYERGEETICHALWSFSAAFDS